MLCYIYLTANILQDIQPTNTRNKLDALFAKKTILQVKLL